MRTACIIAVLALSACNPRSTDADCVAFRESCGCTILCGTTRDKTKEEKLPQCDIGCIDTGEPRPTDADCISDGEKDCVWAP